MNPLPFLPRPGQSIDVPDGKLWCQEWEVTEGRDGVAGRIVFGFECSASAFEDAHLANSMARFSQQLLVHQKAAGLLAP